MAYAWMLAAYPKDYRREHGAELLEPLLVEARRPTVREIANLLLHGLRTRLGRPTSLAVVAWAVVATVFAGVFGAAFGSWVGWRASGAPLQPAWTQTLLADVVPGRHVDVVGSAPEGWKPQLRWSDIDVVLFGDGGDYEATAVGGRVLVPETEDLTTLAASVSARLAVIGWTVQAPTPTGVASCSTPPCDPLDVSRGIRIEASRDGLTLALQVNPAADREAVVSASRKRITPPAARIGSMTGGLAAAAVGFLVFAWASRRTGRPDHPARLAVAFPFGLVLLFWCAPALTAFSLVTSARGEVPAGGDQLWKWLGQPTLSLMFLVGAAFAACSVLLAALPHRRALRQADHAAGW